MGSNSVKIAGVSLVIAGSKEFSEDLKSANQSLRQNAAEMATLDEKYKNNSNNVEYLHKKEELLSKQMEEQKKRTTTLQKARDEYAKSATATADGLAKMDLQIEQSRKFEAKYGAELENTVSALKKTESAAEKLGKQFTDELAKANRSLQQNSAEMETLDAKYKNNSRNVEYLTQKGKMLNKQLKEQNSCTEALQRTRDEYAKSESATADGLAKMDLQIEQSRKQEAQLRNELTKNAESFQKTETAAEKYGKQMDKVSTWSDNAAKKLKGVSVAAAPGLRA